MEINGVMKNKQNRKGRHFPIFFFLHQKLRKPKASPLLIKPYCFPSSNSTVYFPPFFFFLQKHHRVTICASIVKRGKKKTRRQPLADGAGVSIQLRIQKEKDRLIFCARNGDIDRKVIFSFKLPKGVMHPKQKFESEKKKKKSNRRKCYLTRKRSSPSLLVLKNNNKKQGILFAF